MKTKPVLHNLRWVWVFHPCLPFFTLLSVILPILNFLQWFLLSLTIKDTLFHYETWFIHLSQADLKLLYSASLPLSVSGAVGTAGTCNMPRQQMMIICIQISSFSSLSTQDFTPLIVKGFVTFLPRYFLLISIALYICSLYIRYTNFYICLWHCLHYLINDKVPL